MYSIENVDDIIYYCQSMTAYDPRISIEIQDSVRFIYFKSQFSLNDSMDLVIQKVIELIDLCIIYALSFKEFLQ